MLSLKCFVNSNQYLYKQAAYLVTFVSVWSMSPWLGQPYLKQQRLLVRGL